MKQLSDENAFTIAKWLLGQHREGRRVLMTYQFYEVKFLKHHSSETKGRMFRAFNEQHGVYIRDLPNGSTARKIVREESFLRELAMWYRGKLQGKLF